MSNVNDVIQPWEVEETRGWPRVAARTELGELRAYRMGNGARFAVLADESEATWLAYAKAVRRSNVLSEHACLSPGGCGCSFCTKNA